jgi:hypothetical protein
VDIVARVLCLASLACVAFNRYVTLFPLQWIPWPLYTEAVRFSTFTGTYGTALRPCERRLGSPGFIGHPLGSTWANNSGDPRRHAGSPFAISVVPGMLPSAAETALASQQCEISELILHGLLPCSWSGRECCCVCGSCTVRFIQRLGILSKDGGDHR